MMTDKLHPGETPTRMLATLADGSCRTIEELEISLQLNRRQISDGAAKLAMRRYLYRMTRGCYQLSEAGLAAASHGKVIKSGPIGPDTVAVRQPIKDTFRERAWRAMRFRRHFTVGEIAADAARDDADPDGNASRYILHLKKAGYVRELPVRRRGTRLTSNGFKQYQLEKNTGENAPVFRPKKNAIHDYNTGEDVPCAVR